MNMPDHSPECPCLPCTLRRQIEALEAGCLPPLGDLDGLPDCFGDCEEPEDYEA